ncbi:peptidoglycan D,D-transpeptidase FtsI family protein [Metabacillus halosaccharovorans]|uniref:peptidoglycan D,D-transpeptidase FtsI family protein n=1 Tax=Metabacillus halosaccharovorans TaxID=930124 RepID=UPI002042524A|nr:penicillin-binding protein 2 [Metabacillus halosaccharovorans]MCM3444255.1 penicillin-binding protein 2 [Metabacillus halosaccharovorans]
MTTRIEQHKLQKTRLMRVNIFFIIAFLFFVALILRLGFVQIVYGEEYKKEVRKTVDTVVSIPVPRGKIFDRNEKVIVDNVAVKAITYTRMKGTTPQEMLETAKVLSNMIDMDEEEIKQRELKDYWMVTRPDKARDKIKKELLDESLTDKDLYDRQIERITSIDLKEITKEELKIAKIFTKMISGYTLTPQIIKRYVMEEEFAVIGEHLADLPNVDILTDWDRHYPHKNIFRSVLGNVTSSTEGLPSSKLDYFLSRGYSRNDRVGKSQLELYYEDVLQGQKAKVKHVTDQSGNLLETVYVSDGQSGKDLVLSINFDLQKAVEQVIQGELSRAKGRNSFLDRAFVVMMNPNTGEVLSMAGKQLVRENGKDVFRDYALGTINSQYEMGSVVKGATVLAGLEAGVISPETVFSDEKLNLKGTPLKGSHSTSLGTNGIEGALKKSSNVFMFKTAIRMMGKEYQSGMALPKKPEAVQQFRNSLSQFGLGLKTEIDLLNESDGLIGKEAYTKPGLFLDLSIGQYDNYTTMQLAQYISTIANGGYRLKPQLVKAIHTFSNSDDIGAVVQAVQPEVLNKITMDDRYLQQVQEGFRQVYQSPGGTAYKYFGGDRRYKEFQAAGKTGTAQSFYHDQNTKKTYATYNLTLVGYAPYNNPEVAFSIAVPNLDTDTDPVNKYIGQKILKAYFDLKKQHNEE